jgi:membrane dipeptidase
MSSRYPPIFDGHNDTILRMKDGHSFLERDSEGHLDLVRAREGSFGGGFFAIFTRSPEPEEADVWPRDDLPPAPDRLDAQSATIEGIGRLYELERESNGEIKIVLTGSELATCLQNGTLAVLLHVEGAEAIDDKLYALEVFHRAGLRSIGPVWSRTNIFGQGVPFSFPHDPNTGPGLTDLGKDLVRACNRLRIMIDLSHLNEAGFWEVAAISDAPLVASHSNAHALCPTSRNLTDRQLDAIRESGGMVGVNFAVAFLRADGRGDAETPLETLVGHFRYLADRMGIDHVGFGTDFDGALIPAAVGDATGLPHVVDALRGAGFDEQALRKIAHENWVRVLAQTWGG